MRPMPCESELMIAIAPSSWSGPSAAIVAGWIRSRTSATSSGTAHEPPWLSRVIADVLGGGGDAPRAASGVVDEHRMFASRTRPMRSGTCPPPVPSTW